jgi:hypothetical protein
LINDQQSLFLLRKLDLAQTLRMLAEKRWKRLMYRL